MEGHPRARWGALHNEATSGYASARSAQSPLSERPEASKSRATMASPLISSACLAPSNITGLLTSSDLGARSKGLGYVGERRLLGLADLHASDAKKTALRRGLCNVLADGL